METKMRTICTGEGDIRLLFAKDDDRDFIYDMAFEDPSIAEAMGVDEESFPRSKIVDEEPHLFGSEPGMSKYLLIEYDGDIVGVVSHTYNDAPIQNMELDIWLRHPRLTGRGIGSHVLKLLITYLNAAYGITTFVIRPTIKNERAVAAYQKAGFRIVDDFVPERYYTKYLEEFGAGDFGDDTANMVLKLERSA
jgi:RimJ/RimL family protein N-acetyltransferase